MNLNQVTVLASDIENSTDFYTRIGLILIVKSPHYARFECPAGDSTFSIHLSDRHLINGSTTVYFEVEELDKKVNDLINVGILFDEMPNDKSWLWREAHLKDPDGNLIILFHAGLNRKNPPWRIS